MLKGVLEDRDFNSSDGIEEAITKVWDELTFDEVQSAFHNWMSILHSLLRIGERLLLNKHEIISLHIVNLKIGVGGELSVPL
jgi:hypothetical protein